MKIQIMSDLHNEFGFSNIGRTDANIIIMAGDIDIKNKSIKWILNVFPDVPVIYVAGNHEYYHSEVDQVDAELKKLCEGTNIHYLQRESVIIDGIKFIGGTLWTDFLLGGEGLKHYYMRYALRAMNDFKIVHYGEKIFSPPDSVKIFKKTKQYFEQELKDDSFKGKKVIVTHHGPFAQAIGENFQHSPLNPAFASDMTKFMEDYTPDVWVYGHTHGTFKDMDYYKTRVISNPKGYPHVTSAFLPDFTINL